MKRFYLLTTLLIGLSTSAFAQRYIDLEVSVAYPQNVTVISIDENDGNQSAAAAGNDFICTVKNNGPDDCVGDDSIVVRTWWNTQLQFISTNISTGPLKNGESKTFSFDNIVLNYTAAIPKSGSAMHKACDSAFLVDFDYEAIEDKKTDNNAPCSNITFNYWYLNIDNVVADNKPMTVFPNPATSVLNVLHTFRNTQSADIVVRDMMGRIVHSRNLGKNLDGEQLFKIDISSIPAGNYIVELLMDSKKQTNKLSVHK